MHVVDVVRGIDDVVAMRRCRCDDQAWRVVSSIWPGRCRVGHEIQRTGGGALAVW